MSNLRGWAEKCRLKAVQTRQEVKQYFADNPCATQRECALALNLSDNCVTRHVRAIRAERRATQAERMSFRSRETC